MTSFKQSIGNPNNFSLDDVCYLLTIQTQGKDDLGQAITTEVQQMTFCSRLSITRAEFNSAGQLGHKPDMMLVVDCDAYDQEQFLMYRDVKYSIYKTFRRIDNFTELYCEVKAGD
jgi:SPP1 family predicted phage head-tail adaptor